MRGREILLRLTDTATTARDIKDYLETIRDDLASGTSTIDEGLVEAICDDIDDAAAQLEQVLDDNPPHPYR